MDTRDKRHKVQRKGQTIKTDTVQMSLNDQRSTVQNCKGDFTSVNETLPIVITVVKVRYYKEFLTYDTL